MRTVSEPTDIERATLLSRYEAERYEASSAGRAVSRQCADWIRSYWRALGFDTVEVRIDGTTIRSNLVNGWPPR